MTELDDLQRREHQIADAAANTTGTVDERTAALHAHGVLVESAAVHAGYVALAQPPAASSEALKRAAFLAWYRDVEPTCFTGIGDLEPAALNAAFGLLDAAALADAIDREFTAMLGWYFSLAEWHFTAPGRATPALIQRLRSLPAEAWTSLGFAAVDLQRRGLMGRYWTSVACRPR